MKNKKKPILLAILDGFGIGKPDKTNAIFLANTPNYDKLMQDCMHLKVNASEHEVGLPEGQMGNSEVGHMNIGCGRVLRQSLSLIFGAIEDKSFFSNPVLVDAFKHAQKNNSNVHLLGLMSDGGVHSHQLHFYALMKMAQEYNIKNVFVHAFLDGRDTFYASATTYIKQLQEEMKKYSNVHLSTLAGRYYAMDRDKRFERTQKAYDAIVCGKGESFNDPITYLEQSYEQKVYDEFIVPAINSNVSGCVNDNDAVIGVNFRPDRMIQISSFFANPDYVYQPKVKRNNIHFVQMMLYEQHIKAPIAYVNQSVKNSLGEIVSMQNLNQLRIAETEKFAHVTFFLNGGIREPFKNEDRILIPSPKVATYDLQPEMSALIVTEKLVAAIESEKYDFIALNFANPDMVGHTGKMEPTIKAVEFVDNCLGKIMTALQKVDGTMLLTGDHGNCELMIDKDNHPVTTHSLNYVPLVFFNSGPFKLISPNKVAKLADIAPTILTLMNLEIPNEMTGDVLVSEQ